MFVFRFVLLPGGPSRTGFRTLIFKKHIIVPIWCISGASQYTPCLGHSILATERDIWPLFNFWTEHICNFNLHNLKSQIALRRGTHSLRTLGWNEEEDTSGPQSRDPSSSISPKHSFKKLVSIILLIMCDRESHTQTNSTFVKTTQTVI